MRSVTPAQARLGESPAWSAEEQALYWLDLHRPALHRWSERDGHRRIALDRQNALGALLLGERGEALLMRANGLAALTLADGTTRALSTPFAGLPELIPNDGAVDPTGRLWFGTSHREESDPRGILFRTSDGRRFEPADAGFAVCNGPAFNVDGTVLYASDTAQGVVYAYDLDGDGVLHDRRPFARLPEGELPDGLTVDAEGGVWVAHWGGGCVTRWGQDGSLSERLEVPTPAVTAVRFGGADLGELFITTASEDDAGADAGVLYATRPGVAGLPQPLVPDAVLRGPAREEA